MWFLSEYKTVKCNTCINLCIYTAGQYYIPVSLLPWAILQPAIMYTNPGHSQQTPGPAPSSNLSGDWCHNINGQEIALGVFSGLQASDDNWFRMGAMGSRGAYIRDDSLRLVSVSMFLLTAIILCTFSPSQHLTSLCKTPQITLIRPVGMHISRIISTDA
jgi:hypothetical protein